MIRRLIILSFLFSACCRSPFYQEDLKSELSYEDRLMYTVIDITAKKLYKKYGLNCYAEGGSDDANGKLKEIRVGFQTQKPISKEEGAKLVIEAAKMLVDVTNNYEEIRSHLCCFPFTLENVSVSLLLWGARGNPHLAAVSCFSGMIQYLYRYDDPNRFSESEVDPIEEVVKRLNIE